jgi:serine/threonine-protein kinase
MDLARWKKVEEVYYAARERPMAERDPFLLETCGEDRELRREVEELLASGEEAGNLLEHSPVTPPSSFPSIPHSARILVDKQIGAYEVLELIGMGGMGEV